MISAVFVDRPRLAIVVAILTTLAGLLALLREFVAKGAQFIVATHAPILLAYPGARLYSFDAPGGGPPPGAPTGPGG